MLCASLRYKALSTAENLPHSAMVNHSIIWWFLRQTVWPRSQKSGALRYRLLEV